MVDRFASVCWGVEWECKYVRERTYITGYEMNNLSCYYVSWVLAHQPATVMVAAKKYILVLGRPEFQLIYSRTVSNPFEKLRLVSRSNIIPREMFLKGVSPLKQTCKHMEG